MCKNLKKTSKYLSYILRHEPQAIGLQLDSCGWATVDELISLSDISKDLLEEVVFTNDKQRFAFNLDGTKIRANQGHSIENIELGLTPLKPPEHLYHGTVERFLGSIRKYGLKKMERQYVHLSETIDTARNVGLRRGKPIVLRVLASDMFKTRHAFYLSKNGVWLTDVVPNNFICNAIVL